MWRSVISRRSQLVCCVARVAERYSASNFEIDTVSWREDVHEIGEPVTTRTIPEIDLLSMAFALFESV